MYACAHFRYVTCSVRVCTDLLSWMAGRAGAGRLPSDRLGDRKVRIQQKLTPLRCCARPSSMEHFKCPSGVGPPHRYPEQLATPFWLLQKCKKWGGVLVFHQSLLFRSNFPKTQAAIGDHTRKWKIDLFCSFWTFFWPLFCLFFILFRPFLP